MEYRREIDGLRALAVLPVILFHAGFTVFSGGFVGVDVFFVISGYLITTIILSELDQDNFSILKFYERRARRILPALFAVMTSALIAGYFTLMPDEFKNLGQSLVATSVFSNNMLLGLTSGYWDLTSEFKPLLHTWSLGVEEQYYVITPILLMLTWRYAKSAIPALLFATFAASLVFATWYVYASPKWAFYILPTRAWEITMGGICALIMRSNPKIGSSTVSNILGLIGSALVVGSVLTFDSSILAPGPFLLIPTLGACLIILFVRPGTAAHQLLASKPVVFLGLLSYSLYLWHQPIFAFIRIYSSEKPGALVFSIALAVVLAISYLSWRHIETPFRDKDRISRNGIFLFSLIGSAFFAGTGFYLNKTYGLPQRAFDASIRIEDMDKRIYNERVRSYTADQFQESDKPNLLIIGNSFARDFVNITLETYASDKVQIVYRDDLTQCIESASTSTARSLFQKADVIVFGSGELDDKCLTPDINFAKTNNKKIYYVGTKDFGHNLNWLIRYKGQARASKYNEISKIDIDTDARMKKAIPAEHYISLLGPVLIGNKAPITDEQGRMISTDRRHLTKYGAIYFGRLAALPSEYSLIFDRKSQ